MSKLDGLKPQIERLNEALDCGKIVLVFPSEPAAYAWKMKTYRAMSRSRDQSREAYKPDDELYGVGEWDDLIVQHPRETPEKLILLAGDDPTLQPTREE